MIEDLEYLLSCEVCDTFTQVLVIDEEEKPAYCPMCGEPVVKISRTN